jgi:RNA polymerase sigma-70 factor, ECF subfamily
VTDITFEDDPLHRLDAARCLDVRIGPAETSPGERGGRTDAQRIARFERLWDELFARVLGYAIRRTNPDEARDVAAETFTVAWRRLEDVPAGDDALPWLLATARRQLANRRRRDDTRTRHIREAVAAPAAVGGDPADSVAERATLAAAFNRLSADDRETLALIAWDGLQPREAAVVMGCSAATFAVRAHRARRRLGILLDAVEDAPAPDAELDAEGGRP